MTGYVSELAKASATQIAVIDGDHDCAAGRRMPNIKADDDIAFVSTLTHKVVGDMDDAALKIATAERMLKWLRTGRQ